MIQAIENKQTIINIKRGCRICVDDWDDNGVWLRISHENGGTHTSFTREEALELLNAIKLAMGETA